MDGSLEREQRKWTELWIHCVQVECREQINSIEQGNVHHTLHRKEVTLHVGSVLKIRGHPRDLVQVGPVPGG